MHGVVLAYCASCRICVDGVSAQSVACHHMSSRLYLDSVVYRPHHQSGSVCLNGIFWEGRYLVTNLQGGQGWQWARGHTIGMTSCSSTLGARGCLYRASVSAISVIC